MSAHWEAGPGIGELRAPAGAGSALFDGSSQPIPRSLGGRIPSAAGEGSDDTRLGQLTSVGTMKGHSVYHRKKFYVTHPPGCPGQGPAQ